MPRRLCLLGGLSCGTTVEAPRSRIRLPLAPSAVDHLLVDAAGSSTSTPLRAPPSPPSTTPRPPPSSPMPLPLESSADGAFASSPLTRSPSGSGSHPPAFPLALFSTGATRELLHTTSGTSEPPAPPWPPRLGNSSSTAGLLYLVDAATASFAPAGVLQIWRRYVNMHPLGDQYSTKSLSLFLYLYDPKELPDPESGTMIELTLSILDVKHGKHFTRKGRFVFAAGDKTGWGWSNFIQLKTFKHPSRGYLLGSKCVLKADITIIGSSNDG